MCISTAYKYHKTQVIIMDEVRIIEIKKSVFDDNDRAADAMRGELKKKGVFLLNLMSSPGSGKTTTLIQTINRLKHKIRIAVMEADIDSDVDAVKIKDATGVESIQLHTGGMCHLDAEMTGQGLAAIGDQPDLVILENVGNLVCPAEFDTGAVKNAMILSVPEGHDKPLKYPLMFSICDVVVINPLSPYVRRQGREWTHLPIGCSARLINGKKHNRHYAIITSCRHHEIITNNNL